MVPAEIAVASGSPPAVVEAVTASLMAKSRPTSADEVKASVLGARTVVVVVVGAGTVVGEGSWTVRANGVVDVTESAGTA